MPRAHDIQGDARVRYGPLSERPTAAELGSGALWVDPLDQTLYHVQSGNWVRIALPPADDDSSIPAGVPVLYGPYTVDYTDIPHDGDTMTLWTPAIGDVVLHIFPDVHTLTQWDNGALFIGQDVDPNYPATYLAYAGTDQIGTGDGQSLDTVDAYTHAGSAAQAGFTLSTVWICATTDPIQIRYGQAGGGAPDAGSGHVELYALVARAVAVVP